MNACNRCCSHSTRSNHDPPRMRTEVGPAVRPRPERLPVRERSLHAARLPRQAAQPAQPPAQGRH
ncbi:hypothetical protein AVEN_73409-1, partial [Araneus ventricosus]